MRMSTDTLFLHINVFAFQICLLWDWHPFNSKQKKLAGLFLKMSSTTDTFLERLSQVQNYNQF